MINDNFLTKYEEKLMEEARKDAKEGKLKSLSQIREELSI